MTKYLTSSLGKATQFYNNRTKLYYAIYCLKSKAAVLSNQRVIMFHSIRVYRRGWPRAKTEWVIGYVQYQAQRASFSNTSLLYWSKSWHSGSFTVMSTRYFSQCGGSWCRKWCWWVSRVCLILSGVIITWYLLNSRKGRPCLVDVWACWSFDCCSPISASIYPSL